MVDVLWYHLQVCCRLLPVPMFVFDLQYKAVPRLGKIRYRIRGVCSRKKQAYVSPEKPKIIVQCAVLQPWDGLACRDLFAEKPHRDGVLSTLIPTVTKA